MAGRVQLATRGTQDVFFTDDPQYTYFIKNFKKHTNFARFTVDHDVTGELEFGQTLRCTIPQNTGDLIKTVRLRVTLDALEQIDDPYIDVGYVESIGHAMIEHVDILIGGKLIQRVPRDWLQIYSEHYITQTKQTNLSKLIGKPPSELSGTPVNSLSLLPYLGPANTPRECIIDVPFYFYNNPSLAIPLCALTNQQVEIVVTLNTKDKCIFRRYDTGEILESFVNLYTSSQEGLIKDFKVQTELVALDEPERIKFQEVPTDFIITQVQSDVSKIPANETVHNHKVEFVNPVKELYFVIQRMGSGVSMFDYDDTSHTDGSGNTRYTNYEHLRNLQLRLDSDTILDEKTGNVIHMRAVQSGIHHSRTQLFRRFYSYSFALEPERWYPTGQRNFSLAKEQHVKLLLNNDSSVERELRVYAHSYNILRVEDGTARLLFQSGPIGN